MSPADLLGVVASVLTAFSVLVVGWQARRDARMTELAYLLSARFQDELVDRGDPEVMARHLFEELGEIQLSAYAALPDFRKRVDLALTKIEGAASDLADGQ